MKTFTRLFTDHPATVGQTYVQHFIFSASFSLRLLLASLTALVHALIPCCFKSTTSRYIEQLSRLMHKQHGHD